MGIHTGQDLKTYLEGVESFLKKIKDDSALRVFQLGEAGGEGSEAENGASADGSPPQESQDGVLEVVISDDWMSAKGTFYPPEGKGQPLNLEKIEKTFEENGIVWGINWPWVKAALQECNLDRRTVYDVLVANGIPPEDSWPETYTVRKDLLEKKQTQEEGSLYVDFKSVSPFTFVKKGDLLTQAVPSHEGYMGYNMKGEGLPFKKLNPPSPKAGERVVSSPEGLRADCDGCFRFEDDTLTVDKLLVLNEGVNYKTGNIDFDGDLLIHGEILPGFKLRARGDIFTNSVLDTTEVVSQGSVISSAGIIGRPGSLLKAEGRVKAKYVENLSIVARGAVEVQMSVLNAAIKTLDKLVMGAKGILVGSKVQALEGVDLFQVGRERGAPTEILCGMDFTALEKVTWARDQNARLSKHLMELEAQMARFPDHAGELKESCVKIREKIQELSDMARDLLGQIDKKERAEVHVRGTIFPGNSVEICHVTLMVTQPLSRVRFFLDKSRGIIRYERL